LGHALLFSGIAAVIAGLAFGIPIPIQPMKAIAIVAIAEGMTLPEILAAGVLTGGVMLLLGVTGLMGRLHRAVPRVLIRAVQLALGIKLLSTALAMSIGSRPWIGGDSIALAAVSLALMLWLRPSRRVPGALVVCAMGLVILAVSQSHLFTSLRLGLDPPTFHSLSKSDWLAGLWRGAVPQIPLTVLNSVMAVSLLSADLFGERRAEPRKLAVSVGLLNVLFCPFGAMPMCHGAGGLAAHYRFGGRTGGCAVILGAANIALALLFGSSLLPILSHYPQSVLGVPLAFAGVELILICRDQKAARDIFILVLTAVACVVTNIAIGFLVGCGAVILVSQTSKVKGLRSTV
jgi:MFS superfamily sulfate permease-like transporter